MKARAVKLRLSTYKTWLMKKTPVTEVKPGSMYGTPKTTYSSQNTHS